MQVAKMLASFKSPNKILGGDFNLCFDIDKDKRGTMFNNINARETLVNYMEEKLKKNPDKFQYTWKRKRLTMVMSRLDYFTISRTIVNWSV